MKKIITGILALCSVLCFASCNSKPEIQYVDRYIEVPAAHGTHQGIEYAPTNNEETVSIVCSDCGLELGKLNKFTKEVIVYQEVEKVIYQEVPVEVIKEVVVEVEKEVIVEKEIEKIVYQPAIEVNIGNLSCYKIGDNLYQATIYNTNENGSAFDDEFGLDSKGKELFVIDKNTNDIISKPGIIIHDLICFNSAKMACPNIFDNNTYEVIPTDIGHDHISTTFSANNIHKEQIRLHFNIGLTSKIIEIE